MLLIGSNQSKSESHRTDVPFTMKCAIICSGTSLRDTDLDAIDVPKIGINWSYKATPSDVHVVTAGSFLDKFGSQLEELTPDAIRFCSGHCNGAFTPKRIAKFMRAEFLRGDKIPALPKNYDVFKHGWVLAGGGPCALQVAVSLGYDHIMFVGLDLMSHEGDQHFYKEHYVDWPNAQFDLSWAIQSSYLMQIKPQLDARGIKVTNTGRSDIFPEARL